MGNARTRSKTTSPLAAFIRQALTAHELTISEMASRLRYAGNSFISGVLNGTKALPGEATEAWADAMELNAFERTRWIHLCGEHLAPAVVRTYLRQLLRDNQAQAARIRELEAAIVDQSVARAKARRGG